MKQALVNFANVHMIIEAQNDPFLLEVLNHADLNCPDGKPIALTGHWRYGDHVSQVAGPEFMPLFCEQSVPFEYRHFLYGGGTGVAERAAQRLSNRYPGIRIVGTYAPPYRLMTQSETDEVCRIINESGAQIVWVCLGCPKQEKWMYENRDRLKARALLGVGQAFDILAGTKMRAPRIIRSARLEWAYRLAKEPGRLWRRYLTTNSIFVYLMMKEMIASIFSRREDRAQ